MSSHAPTAAMPALSLKRNLLHAGTGKIVFALSQFCILAIVARLGTLEEVGAMTLASAIVTPLFFLASMGMRDVHAVDDLDRFTRADYVALRVIAASMAMVLILVVALTYQSSSGWLVQATTVASGTVKFFGAQSSLCHGMFQRAERMDFVARSILVRALLGLLVFGMTFWAFRNLPLALLVEAAAWYGTYLFVDRRLMARLGAQTPWREVIAVRARRLAALACWIMPVGVSLLLARASTSIPPLVLDRYADLATVGVFGAMAYLNTAISMVAGTLGSASAARLRRQYRQGKRRAFLRLAAILTCMSAIFGGAGVLVAWLAGDMILGLVYGDAYRRADLLVVVMIASAATVASAPLLTALNAGQAFRVRVTNSIITCVVSVAASLLLIPAFGATGAAWSLVVAMVAALLLTLLSVHSISARLVEGAANEPPEIGAQAGTRS